MIEPVLSPYGSTATPGPSVFDAPDTPAQPTPSLYPTDDENAGMQRRIFDAYAAWVAKMDENPPPLSSGHDTAGEYPAFSYMLDADPDAQAELLKAVQNAVGPDAS